MLFLHPGKLFHFAHHVEQSDGFYFVFSTPSRDIPKDIYIYIYNNNIIIYMHYTRLVRLTLRMAP